MAKIEDNAKRRSNEMDEQSVTSIPPKKRFLSRASSPDEEDQDEPDIFKVMLIAFNICLLRKYSLFILLIRNLWKHFVKMQL